jgi:hypothetical protein
MAIERAHPDAGLASHGLERDVGALLGEQGERRGQQPFAVAQRVGAPWLLGSNARFDV